MALVSCIMPTRGRRELGFRALQCLAAQTFTDWELIVLDDAEQPSFCDGDIAGVLPDHPVYYARHLSRNIAEKRNLCIEAALGDYVCHWDSDDWSGPKRLVDQVERIRMQQKAVTGYHSMYFVDPAERKAYWYANDASYAVGTSLVYTVEWAKAHPFVAPEDHPNWGEDNLFVKQARDAHELLSVSAEFLMVARIHTDNSCPKRIHADSASYFPMDLKRIPFGARA